MLLYISILSVNDDSATENKDMNINDINGSFISYV